MSFISFIKGAAFALIFWGVFFGFKIYFDGEGIRVAKASAWAEGLSSGLDCSLAAILHDPFIVENPYSGTELECFKMKWKIESRKEDINSWNI